MKEEGRKVSPQDCLLLLAGLLGSLGDLATRLLGLINTLDDTDSDGLPHVTDGEATKRRVFGVGLNAHRLGWDELDHGGITGLDGLGACLSDRTRSTIDLGLELGELACNVGGVAIQDG